MGECILKFEIEDLRFDLLVDQSALLMAQG